MPLITTRTAVAKYKKLCSGVIKYGGTIRSGEGPGEYGDDKGSKRSGIQFGRQHNNKLQAPKSGDNALELRAEAIGTPSRVALFTSNVMQTKFANSICPFLELTVYIQFYQKMR